MADVSESKNGRRKAVTVPMIGAFVIALALTSLVLNLWGDHIAVRALIGLSWGSYCLWAFGPDLLHLIRQREDPKARP
jgi:hypothetical protein